MIAALFGGTLYGIIGALVAIPLAAAGQIGVREFVLYRRAALLEEGENVTLDEDEGGGSGPPPPDGEGGDGEPPPLEPSGAAPA